MGIEFMTGATVFALINLLLALGLGYVMSLLIRKIWIFTTSSDEDIINENITLNIRKEVVLIVGIASYLIFFGSIAQPKLTIDPVQNRELIEYQDNSEEVLIETPPPRTERMEGFTPLKE